MDISYETVRAWWNRFGPMFANEIKKSGQRRCGACRNGDGTMRATKRYGHPQVIVTDRLRSYQVAMPDIGIETRKETGRWFNNRAENSRQSLRRRKRTVTNFRSARALLKFATGYASVHDHFNLTLSLGELNGTMVESNQVVAMSFRERLT